MDIIRINNYSDVRFRKAVLQSVTAAVFLALCILACFTAFFRDGSITVSAVSAVLMTVFFAMFGICVGIYAGSFLAASSSDSVRAFSLRAWGVFRLHRWILSSFWRQFFCVL